MAGPNPAPLRTVGSQGISRRRGGLRRRSESSETVRYFVGHPADGDGKPTLEQEVASEPEGLVIASKNHSRVYFVHEYCVTERIEGSEVRLEKERPLPPNGFLPPMQV